MRAETINATLLRDEAAAFVDAAFDCYLDDALYEPFVRPLNHEPANFDFDGFVAALGDRKPASD